MPDPQQQQPRQQPAAESGSDFQKLIQKPVSFGANGVEINNTDDLHRCASFIFNSGIAPKGMDTVPAVMIAISLGAELGMKPMSALQNIAVINGRPSVWGDAMLGLCRQSALFVAEDFKEWEEDLGGEEGMTAFCESHRVGSDILRRQFSMGQAKRAGLLEKNTPWKTYPERMRMFRARSWCLRDNFGDILGGMRAAEEQQDCEPTSTTAATQSHIEQAKAERAAVTVHDVPGSQSTSAAACNAIEALATETTAERIDRENAGDPDPPLDPPTPEEVARADDNRDHEQAVANRDAVTDDQIATGRDIIARIGKCVSPANFDKVQDDAVALFNDGRLAQVDCVKISALIEIGRAGLAT